MDTFPKVIFQAIILLTLIASTFSIAMRANKRDQGLKITHTYGNVSTRHTQALMH